MLPESTNGTGGGGLAVPMDWLCAEYAADDVMRTSGLVEPGSLEFRAGLRTLALTILLSGAGTADWLRLTAHDHPWSAWVDARLETAAAGPPDADLALARDTWRRLRATELRAADLAGLAGLAGVDESRQVWLPAWRLGVALGHLALHLC
ncbi:hypothetical protein ACIGO8_06685 [Streptomyces sp. NPDC053493]|uniref:hypothetical protein n=1 Tax=Streptomyces sp. NPDC053493 TaxID=3365705 RepID=UPI0037D4B7BE